MDKEPIDPVYEYVDKKVTDVQNALEKSLLDTQRHIAAYIITTTTGETIASLRKLKSREADEFIDQLIASASAVKTKAATSKNPLTIAERWHRECYDRQEQFGIKVIRLSSPLSP